MTVAPLGDVVTYLDGYLAIDLIPDHETALNGLQLQNSGAVTGFVAAVDASQQTIDRVVAECAPGTMLVVHHGLFWDGNQPVRGRRYRKLRTLIDHDVAVYAAHIPLDVHPVVGNNAVLARELGITDPSPFDMYRGVPFGAAGKLAVARDALITRLEQLLHTRVQLIPGGPAITARVGVITGAAGDRVPAAHKAGVDTYITGEGAHHTVFDALELGVNLIYAGHYATETVGVQALARQLAERYRLPWLFHDHPTGR